MIQTDNQSSNLTHSVTHHSRGDTLQTGPLDVFRIMLHNKYVSEFSPPPMVNFSNDDIEEFAKWLGFDGSDVDTFYEAYYDIDYYDDQEVEAATELGNDSQA